MTTQTLINLSLTDAQIANIDAALNILETELTGLIALDSKQKQRLRRMGDKSESFSRQALQVVAQNPQMIPANIPVGEALADLKLLDQLRPRLGRLSRLFERGSDTDAALGNDIMTVAFQAYGLLKLTGRAEGMEALRRELASSRFKRGGRAAAKPGSGDGGAVASGAPALPSSPREVV